MLSQLQGVPSVKVHLLDVFLWSVSLKCSTKVSNENKWRYLRCFKIRCQCPEKSVPNSGYLSQGNYFALFFLLSQLEGRLAGSSQTKQEGSQHSWVWASPPLWGASTLAWCLHQPSWSWEVRKLSRTCCYESSAASLLFVLLLSEHWKVFAGDTFSLVLFQQWKGLPAVLQESQRHKDHEWNASSMNSDLFPACSDEQGMRPLVSTGMVPLPHLGSDAYCFTFCVAATITSHLSPWHFLSSHLTDSWHFAVTLTSTPSPSFRYQELLSDGHIDLQSWVTKRDKSCALIFWDFLLGTADILQLSSHECS